MSATPTVGPARSAPVPTETEILASLLLGLEAGAPPLPDSRGQSIRSALEAAMLPALSRSPCFVSFSGGRDSSAVLAVATTVARRHGLPEPVPAIMRYSDAPASDETSWQELVLEHLGLRNQEVVTLRHEQDLLGTIATRVLRRHGVRWPANAYMHEPLFERVQGGSLMTGVGGDELFQTRGSPFVLVAHRQQRPHWRDAVSLTYAALPRSVRAAVKRRRSQSVPWLTSDGQALVGRVVARDDVSWPHRYDTALRMWCRTRAFGSVQRLLPELGVHHQVMVVNPFLVSSVLAEFVRVGGATGFASRSAGMAELFHDVLPAAVLIRPTKASFDRPVWGPAARAFAGSWTGDGLDHRLVNADALRREWLAPQPSFSTAMLLHAAWLRTVGGGGQPTAANN